MAIVLTALHTAPLPREFIGFKPERKNLFGMVAPDRQWLGFTQFVSEGVLGRGFPIGFDAPTADFIDDPNNKDRNTVWPSFPIRYAHRRQLFATGGFGMPMGAAQPAAAPAPPAPVPVNPTTSGSGAAGF